MLTANNNQLNGSCPPFLSQGVQTYDIRNNNFRCGGSVSQRASVQFPDHAGAMALADEPPCSMALLASWLLVAPGPTTAAMVIFLAVAQQPLAARGCEGQEVQLGMDLGKLPQHRLQCLACAPSASAFGPLHGVLLDDPACFAGMC